jgi:hypothetical protein
MDVQELASEQMDKLSEHPAAEQVAVSTAMALWEIVKALDGIRNAMPQQPEL